MSIVVIDGLDNRTTSDTVKNYCQDFGRILNCYIKSNQCLVTFADKHHAEEFLHNSPHRIDTNGPLNATWKTTLNQYSSQKRSITSNNSIDVCRLTIRGTFEQLEEKNLIRYFSRFGHVRMCISNQSEGFATITFDDRISYGRALNESKHFLNGRSLIVEPYEMNLNKRQKTVESNSSSQFDYEQKRLETQYQERLQLYENEKQQMNIYLIQQRNEFQQQIIHYQYLLKQSLDEITSKDKQIEQLKQENKDIE